MTKQAPIVWMWNKKQVTLEDLDEKQLYSVKKLIESDNKRLSWFGYKGDDILKEIEDSLKYKQQVYKLIKDMRIKRAVLNADFVLNGMVRCMTRNDKKLLN